MLARRVVIGLTSLVAICLCGSVFDAIDAEAVSPPIVVTPGGGGGDGTVGIGVHTASGSGSPGQSSGPVGTGDSTNPCVAAEDSATCQAYLRATMCSAVAADWAGGLGIGLTGLTAAQLASVNAVLAGSGCPPFSAATVAAVSAADLAQVAYGQLRLPAPVPSRYPMGTLPDGRPYTVVNTYMWFWTDPTAWKPLTKKVCAGALCATATASPVTLTLDPGDGDQPVACTGPGTAWVRPAAGSWVPPAQNQGCDYRYLRSTFGQPGGVLTATYTITWHVAWTGTNGTAGTLRDLATTARSTFAVAELQSVVTQ